jgi:hypothetical protein
MQLGKAGHTITTHPQTVVAEAGVEHGVGSTSWKAGRAIPRAWLKEVEWLVWHFAHRLEALGFIEQRSCCDH